MLGAPCCALCVLVATVLAERVVVLDDTYVLFENSRASVEVTVPPFVLGGNLTIRYIPSSRSSLSHIFSTHHYLASR
jgi:hypothetical protein